jgi:hypothetical protein
VSRDGRARRDVRYELRRVLWSESSKARTQACGRTRLPARQRQLRVREAGEQAVAHFTGAMVCGSPWACPVCSAKIAAARADEIGRGVGAWVDAGNLAVLVSLTVQHGRSDSLEDTLDAVLEAFQSITSGRAWIMSTTTDVEAALTKLVAHEAKPLDALTTLGTAREVLDRLTQAYVARARRNGASWTDVGIALGVSKQSAWEKFGRFSGEEAL